MKLIKRSKWWIVSTHVLTTGFVMPFITGMVGGICCVILTMGGNTAFLFMLAVQTAGYLGGAYYSLSYLKKNVTTQDWTACIVPSVVSFAVLEALGLLLNVASSSLFSIIGIILFYGVILTVFAKVTANGFRVLQKKQTERTLLDEFGGLEL